MFQNLVEEISIATIKYWLCWKIVHIQYFKQKTKYDSHQYQHWERHGGRHWWQKFLSDIWNIKFQKRDLGPLRKARLLCRCPSTPPLTHLTHSRSACSFFLLQCKDVDHTTPHTCFLLHVFQCCYHFSMKICKYFLKNATFSKRQNTIFISKFIWRHYL